MKRTLLTLGSLAFLLLLGFGPAPTAGAQTPVPPTVPCEGCGPSGTKNPGANQAWAYPEHHCLPDGSSAYSLTFGLGKNATGPASFYVRFTTGPLPDRSLGVINPGKQKTVYPLVTVAPGTTVTIEVAAFINGAPVQFGNGSTDRTFTLTCPCEQSTSTTVPSTPSTVPSPPTSVTAVPGTPTTTPGVVTSVPGTTLFELPATGTTSAWIILAGALLAFFGFCAWLLGRGGEQVER